MNNSVQALHYKLSIIIASCFSVRDADCFVEVLKSFLL